MIRGGLKCTVRDRLRAEYDESVLQSSQVNETLAKVAGTLALDSYRTVMLEQARCEARVSETLADLNQHQKEHGC
jgi:hypothetical protein